MATQAIVAVPVSRSRRQSTRISPIARPRTGADARYRAQPTEPAERTIARCRRAGRAARRAPAGRRHPRAAAERRAEAIGRRPSRSNRPSAPVHRGVFLVGHAGPTAGARDVAGLLACAAGRGAQPQCRRLRSGASRDHGAVPHVDGHAAGTVVAPRRAVASRAALDRARPPPAPRPSRSPPRSHAARPRRDARPRTSSTPRCERARAARLVSPADVLAALDRAQPSRRGAARCAQLLDDRPALTRSAAERRLLDLIRRGGLPAPETNVRVAGHEVDCLWPAERLVVEVDGYAYHAGPRGIRARPAPRRRPPGRGLPRHPRHLAAARRRARGRDRSVARRSRTAQPAWTRVRRPSPIDPARSVRAGRRLGRCAPRRRREPASRERLSRSACAASRTIAERATSRGRRRRGTPRFQTSTQPCRPKTAWRTSWTQW